MPGHYTRRMDGMHVDQRVFESLVEQRQGLRGRLASALRELKTSRLECDEVRVETEDLKASHRQTAPSPPAELIGSILIPCAHTSGVDWPGCAGPSFRRTPSTDEFFVCARASPYR